MHALVTLRLGPRTRAWCGICQRIWPPGLHWIGPCSSPA